MTQRPSKIYHLNFVFLTAMQLQTFYLKSDKNKFHSVWLQEPFSIVGIGAIQYVYRNHTIQYGYSSVVHLRTPELLLNTCCSDPRMNQRKKASMERRMNVGKIIPEFLTNNSGLPTSGVAKDHRTLGVVAVLP